MRGRKRALNHLERVTGRSTVLLLRDYKTAMGGHELRFLISMSCSTLTSHLFYFQSQADSLVSFLLAVLRQTCMFHFTKLLQLTI